MVRWLRRLAFVAVLALCWGLVMAASLPLSGAAITVPSPTLSPISTARKVTLDPTTAQTGATITVIGSGFSPGDSGAIVLDSVDNTVAHFVADSSGSFAVKVPLNDVAAGTHMVCAELLLQQTWCAQLVVSAPTPSQTATPTHAPTSTANVVPVPAPPVASPTLAPLSPAVTATPVDAVPAQPTAGVASASPNYGGIALLLVAVAIVALSVAFVLWRRRTAVALALAALAPSSRILISYRREDGGPVVDRLRDELAAHFGQGEVLMDVWRTEPGLDYTEAVDRAVAECAATIAVIGPTWREGIDDPDDYVRYEVSTTLAQSRRVLPVLVQGASLPGTGELPSELRPLARRMTFAMDEAGGDAATDDLIRALDQAITSERSGPAQATDPVRRSAQVPTDEKKKRSLSDLVPWIGAATAVATAATGLYTLFTRPDPAVGSYQTQVLASCNRVQATLSANHNLDVLNLGPRSFTVRKAGLERVITQNIADVKNEFALLNGQPTPSSLSQKKARAAAAQQDLYAVWQGDLQFVDANVRDGESLDELNVQYGTRATADSAAMARVSATMSALANGECKLSGSPAHTGSTT